MADIKAVTDATFEELVLKSDKPVVVDFWAAWCGPCKMVAPEMEKLAEKYEGVVEVVKVDVDANPGLSRAFNIMSIPTIAFFRPASSRWASSASGRSSSSSSSSAWPSLREGRRGARAERLTARPPTDGPGIDRGRRDSRETPTARGSDGCDPMPSERATRAPGATAWRAGGWDWTRPQSRWPRETRRRRTTISTRFRRAEVETDGRSTSTAGPPFSDSSSANWRPSATRQPRGGRRLDVAVPWTRPERRWRRRATIAGSPGHGPRQAFRSR